MQLAMIGLGKMGGNMTERLLRGGHDVVAFDRSADVVQKHAALGATGAATLAEAIARLAAPRVVWIMVPAGDAVDQTIDALRPLLSGGDIVIDGGNSNFHDTIRRARALAEREIQLIDCGTSGGVWGLERGYCMMIGGPTEAVDRLDPIFSALAPGIGDIPRTPGFVGRA